MAVLGDYQKAISGAVALPQSVRAVPSTAVAEVVRDRGALDIDEAIRGQSASSQIAQYDKEMDLARSQGKTDLGFGMADVGLSAGYAAGKVRNAQQRDAEMLKMYDYYDTMTNYYKTNPDAVRAVFDNYFKTTEEGF